MAYGDSAYCLDQFNRYAGRSAGDSITDASKYERLSEAQVAVVAEMMTTVPKSLNPTVPYTLFPVAFPNAESAGSGTVTLTGASFLAGATITATASSNNFTSASVGSSLVVQDPTTRIPLTILITAYTSATAVDGTALVDVPVTMQSVAISGWGIGVTTATDGQVFTFGFTANGTPLMPMGKAEIFPTLASWPDFPWVEGYDYVSEGTQIRLPNNRTWSAPLYWYGVVQPPDITASVNPILHPVGARELIVFRAVSNFANEGNQNGELSDRMESRYQQAKERWYLAWKTQFRSGGALGSFSGLRYAEAGGSLNGRIWNV